MPVIIKIIGQKGTLRRPFRDLVLIFTSCTLDEAAMILLLRWDALYTVKNKKVRKKK